MLENYRGHDIDLSRSRDVIDDVIIRSAIGHFLLVGNPPPPHPLTDCHCNLRGRLCLGSLPSCKSSSELDKRFFCACAISLPSRSS